MLRKEISKESQIKEKSLMKVRPLKIEKIMEKNLIKFPLFSQEFRKGKRVFVDDQLNVTDINGESSHCNFAKYELEQVFKQFDFIKGFDATLYSHNMSQRQMKKEYEYDKINISSALKLYINDIKIEGVNAYARFNILNELKKFVALNKYDTIIVNNGMLLNTKEQLFDFYASSLEKGYLGIVLTKYKSFYISDSNTKSKFKINP